MNAPSLQIDAGGIAAIVALTALAGVGALLYVKRAQIGPALDPTSDKNLAYSTVNAIGAAVTGDKSFSLGSRIYDWTHADDDPAAWKPGEYERIFGGGAANVPSSVSPTPIIFEPDNPFQHGA